MIIESECLHTYKIRTKNTKQEKTVIIRQFVQDDLKLTFVTIGLNSFHY